MGLRGAQHAEHGARVFLPPKRVAVLVNPPLDYTGRGELWGLRDYYKLYYL